MFQRGWFHVDVTLSDPLQQVLSVVRQYGPSRVQPLSERVIDELADAGRFAGLIVQVSPERGPWLACALDRLPRLPVLALLESADRATINAMQARGVATAVLPLSMPPLVAFVQRALTHNFVPSERVARTIASLAEARGLTAREVQLLGYSLGDEPRARVRRRLGITENTLKTQIRGLLRKCGERNLDALAKNVLRSALAITNELVAAGRQEDVTEELTLACE
jgi:DNA-binding CsgD family transcriptional regulator